MGTSRFSGLEEFAQHVARFSKGLRVGGRDCVGLTPNEGDSAGDLYVLEAIHDGIPDGTTVVVGQRESLPQFAEEVLLVVWCHRHDDGARVTKLPSELGFVISGNRVDEAASESWELPLQPDKLGGHSAQ